MRNKCFELSKVVKIALQIKQRIYGIDKTNYEIYFLKSVSTKKMFKK